MRAATDAVALSRPHEDVAADGSHPRAEPRRRDPSINFRCSSQSRSKLGPGRSSRSRKNASTSMGDANGAGRRCRFQSLLGRCPEPLAQLHALSPCLTHEHAILIGNHETHGRHGVRTPFRHRTWIVLTDCTSKSIPVKSTRLRSPRCHQSHAKFAETLSELQRLDDRVDARSNVDQSHLNELGDDPMIESIIGRNAARYVNMIDELNLEDLSTRYTFMNQDEYRDLAISDPAQGMRVYWYEILARAHFCSAIAVMRTRRWLTDARPPAPPPESMESAGNERNLLGFAASFRGLLESAADTATSLSVVPHTLSRLSSKIARALSGKLETIVVSSDIENELIHFSHARYLKSSEAKGDLTHHKARTTQTYMDVLKKGGVANVARCYGELCDLTHPGATSVMMWLRSVDGSLTLSARQDESIIQGYVQRNKDIFQDLLMFGFNPAIVTLAVLNHLPEEGFHTPELLSWNLDSINLWRTCHNELRKRRVGEERR